MLLLTRSEGQRIFVQVDDKLIIMTHRGNKGTQTKISFEADESIIIHREEIWKKYKEQTT